MNKNERKELLRKNTELYGDAILLVYYQTNYSTGQYAIKYAYYMSDERFRKRLDKALSQKDIIAVDKKVISSDEWIDVYANKERPLRVIQNSPTWDSL